ncbi:hypothetical protein FBUS_09999, partial [Fasciolopsis buskii]
SSASRERRRNRLRAPFGDEDIQIVFAGSGGRDVGYPLFLSERFFFRYGLFSFFIVVWPPTATFVPLSRSNFQVEAASDDVLVSCHDNSYVTTITDTATMMDEKRKALSSKLDSVYFNEVSFILGNSVRVMHIQLYT